MVSGLEIARIINKFESSMAAESAQNETPRRYQKLANTVLERCYSTYHNHRRNGKPFHGGNRGSLSSGYQRDSGFGCSGEIERLVQQSKSLYDPLKRNNLSVFNGP